MTDVVSQLEALIAGIAAKTPRECDKWCTRGHSAACDGRHSRLMRTEIARTVERIGAYLLNHVGEHVGYGEHWAAAFRATQEQETQT